MAINPVGRKARIGLLKLAAHPVHIDSQLLVAQTLARSQCGQAAQFPLAQLLTIHPVDRPQIACVQFLFITLKFHNLFL